MGNVLVALLFLLAVTYPVAAIPATGGTQAITLFGVWAVAIAVAALLAQVGDDDDG
jgi:hypothetical protein